MKQHPMVLTLQLFKVAAGIWIEPSTNPEILALEPEIAEHIEKALELVKRCQELNGAPAPIKAVHSDLETTVQIDYL